jgi:hypothetical protein
MDSLSLCWRGMAGVGKTTALHEALRSIAALRGVPFTIRRRPLQTRTAVGDVTEAAASEEGAGPAEGEANQFLYETSLVHIGLDIARMSMQDKHILRPVLVKLGQGSQVLAGEQGRGSRILVLYHAHLLSSESVLLLQACLEQNEGDLSIWMTSEMPVPQRIRDWFVEIPVAGYDRAFEQYAAAMPAAAKPLSPSAQPKLMNWPDVFQVLFRRWLASPPPTLKEVKEVKAIVYEMMMRNLRWVEVVHFILDVVLCMEGPTPAQRQACVKALAGCEATAGGYTIPSYRIPILWESLFLQLRSILCSEPKTDEGGSTAAASAKRVSKPRKKVVVTTAAAVATV